MFDSGPFEAGGESGAASAAELAGPDIVNDGVGREFVHTASGRGEAAIAEVLVNVKRGGITAVFGGEMYLAVEEGGYGSVTNIDDVALDGMLIGIGDNVIEGGGDGVADAFSQAPRPEVAQDDCLGIFGLDTGVEVRLLIDNDLQKGGLVADAYASHLLEMHLHTYPAEAFLKGLVKFAAAARDTARSQSDAYFAEGIFRCCWRRRFSGAVGLL